MGKFKHVVAAGSWDHLHLGHKQFLQKAFEIGEEVSIGITSDEMITNKPFTHSLEPFDLRKETVTNYMKQQGWYERAKFEKLENIYGPTLTNNDMEALIMTKKTRRGGKQVNQARTQKGLSPLQLIKVPLALASDGKEISSERIRAGEINREGLVYMQYFHKHPKLRLPNNLREIFHEPFGKVINEVKEKLQQCKPTRIICVGDVVTKSLVGRADIYVVDLMVGREKKYNNVSELGLKETDFVKVINPAGVITKELAENIALGKNVLVKGEEDLAVLPAVLTVPLGSVVLYGQPHEGVVWVEVTEEKKTEAYKLLTQFINEGEEAEGAKKQKGS